MVGEVRQEASRLPARGCRVSGVASPNPRLAWGSELPATVPASAHGLRKAGRPMASMWPAPTGKACDAHRPHCPVGEGVGRWSELLEALGARGGVPLVLEPHTQYAGRDGGSSGPKAFRRALTGIRTLLSA